MPIEPLPTTGIATITNLCETLKAHGGSRELYELTNDLRMAFDELLLVTRAGEMLGLVENEADTVSLTPLGNEVVDAPADGRKRLLKRQLMTLKVFQHVVKLLENAEGHRVPAEVIREQLTVLLPQEQSRNLFTTLLNWGRFADLFTYSRETDLFQLADG